jgi:hypothetical protein
MDLIKLRDQIVSFLTKESRFLGFKINMLQDSLDNCAALIKKCNDKKDNCPKSFFRPLILFFYCSRRWLNQNVYNHNLNEHIFFSRVFLKLRKINSLLLKSNNLKKDLKKAKDALPSVMSCKHREYSYQDLSPEDNFSSFGIMFDSSYIEAQELMRKVESV